MRARTELKCKHVLASITSSTHGNGKEFLRYVLEVPVMNTISMFET